VSEVPAVPLADLIFQLRSDLSYAAWQGESNDLKFVVGPVELELAVVVDASRGASGKAALWVLDVGAEAKHATQVTHRIRLTLQPVDPSGRRSRIAGTPLAGEEDAS
jgi:hypothetical protein